MMWLKKAEDNHEYITIIKDDDVLCDQFITQFEQIHNQYYSTQEVQDFPVDKIIKRLEILKNYVVLEDEEDVTFIFYCKKWSGKRGSNSRPRPWQGRALPTELFPHNLVILNGARGQTWTGTPRKARDFKSLASTDSATRATFKLSVLRTDGAYYRDFHFAVK